MTNFTVNVHYSSPFIHRVTVHGLKPNTKYYYSVGPKHASSSVHHFNSGRPKGAHEGVLTVAFVGDIGQTSWSEETRDNILTSLNHDKSMEFLLIVGDLAYADGGNII